VGALALAAQPFVIIRQRLVGRRHVEMRVAIVAGRRLAAGAQRIGCHLAEGLRPAGCHLRAFQSWSGCVIESTMELDKIIPVRFPCIGRYRVQLKRRPEIFPGLKWGVLPLESLEHCPDAVRAKFENLRKRPALRGPR
jgi:hypothetical protein